MPLILIVEDEFLLRTTLMRRMERRGHVVHEAPTLAEARRHLALHRPDVVLLDLSLPDGSGLDLLEQQREPLAESLVVVMTGSGQIEDAVRAMKLGALDFLQKPLDHEELIALVDRALERRRERADAERSRRERESGDGVQVVAESPGMKNALGLATTVATSTSTTVLVQGETGAGKEVVARVIHARMPGRDVPLCFMNCAAMPEMLAESELFGHEKGAFTDARETRKGMFELADGGVLVLDEIGEMPAPLQSKLLRCLEERRIRRVGASREILVTVRVIALTNRDLEERVKEGSFRKDLFFRLNVFPITVPPLRERREDIPPLSQLFLERFARPLGKSIRGFTADARRRLEGYDWPGNVRELRNIVERAVILERDEEVAVRHLAIPAPGPFGAAEDGEILPLDEVEFRSIVRAVRACEGNQSAAAKLLGVTRDQLRYRVARYRDEGRWNIPEALDVPRAS